MKPILIAGAAALLSCLMAVPAVQAQDAFPTKPITLIVGWTPGGANDFIARTFAKELETELGQPIIVENKPGAAGQIGMQAVNAAQPDGYTLALIPNEFVIEPNLYTKLPYSQADFAPLSMLAYQPVYLAVSPDLGVSDLEALVAKAKATPGDLTYGSWSIGGTGHLGMELFEQASGTDMVHVPYPGLAPALTDVIAGVIDMAFAGANTAGEFFKSGRLVPIAIAAPERSSIYPDVPTFVEQGYKDFEVTLAFGLVAPAETPKEIVTRLHAAIQKVSANADLVDRFKNIGFVVEASESPEAYKAYLDEQTALWGKVIKDANIVLN